ncbi:aspartyl protease family protein [Paucibacter sp. R3-3]|uniref:Aspartyl protease family protein n=1 Tax=Roseateles agri TaxID=3098619 RepID=A0ABU5DRP9_9BURK|nr:aspartyl protease family protein [Paucibacter sp. R3-3]MDY0748997.1 aspartyl protease family protein [Paucibacter sp. R3-3]
MGSTGSLPILPADGPAVDLRIGLSSALVSALRSVGQAVPGPLLVSFLVDTGASTTVIEPWLVSHFSLSPRSTSMTQTAGGVVSVQQYDISLEIPDKRLIASGMRVGNLLASEMALNFIRPKGGLLGRDVLDHCTMSYDGPSGAFQLHW